jgi:hypothetical protein
MVGFLLGDRMEHGSSICINIYSLHPSHLTLYKTDGTTEIKVGDSFSLLVEGNTDGNPLFVKEFVTISDSSSRN